MTKFSAAFNFYLTFGHKHGNSSIFEIVVVSQIERNKNAFPKYIRYTLGIRITKLSKKLWSLPLILKNQLLVGV